jgi:hypothetical protein
MPLEIKELHIKATLSDSNQRNGSGGSDRGAGEDNAKEELVSMCVDKVLQILMDKKER